MNIQFTQRRVRLVRFAIALVAVSLAAYVAYAATTLTISNSGSVTVATGTNLLASLGQTTSTTCSSSTGPYSDTSLAITTWSVPVGGSTTMWACVWNNGASAHTLAISGSGFPSGVTFSSTGGVSVPAAGYQLVSFTLTASSSATTGSFSGAAITIA
jgi:hypothetical protein